MVHQPRAIVCRRLHRMLFVGIAIANCALLIMFVSVRGFFGNEPLGVHVGSLGLSLGGGMIGASWLGYIVEGAWRFRLRTLMATTTVIAVLFAAWPVWIKPRIIHDVHVSWRNQSVVIEITRQSEKPSSDALFAEIAVMEFTIHVFEPISAALELFPFILLPFILRHRGEPIADQGDEASPASS